MGTDVGAATEGGFKVSLGSLMAIPAMAVTPPITTVAVRRAISERLHLLGDSIPEDSSNI